MNDEISPLFFGYGTLNLLLNDDFLIYSTTLVGCLPPFIVFTMFLDSTPNISSLYSFFMTYGWVGRWINCYGLIGS